MFLSLFDRTKNIDIFTTFLLLPVSGDGLLAAHFQDFPYPDMGYSMKEKSQEGKSCRPRNRIDLED